ncbi:MAG: Rhodanese-like domain [Thermoanaerobaculia bacterium]|jgi:3-mercaptopyruvate sulfurtransferase SseA|nr:Rhodanese-like domain [Thermoanaerobaculia bacterium]
MNTRTIAMISVTVLALIFAGWAATRDRSVPAPETPALVRSTTPARAATTALDAIPRIDASTLRERMTRGEVVVIDVRDIDSFTALHIAGAMHIPLSRIEGEVPYLRGPKPIVTYCT